MLRAVQGVYHNGVVIPREKVPYHGDIDVVIVFVGDIEGEKNEGAQAYEKLRARIAEKYPELLKETDGEAKEAFEKLSQKVADTMPYKTIEEFERVMRGDEYGLIALHKTSSSKCKGSCTLVSALQPQAFPAVHSVSSVHGSDGPGRPTEP